VCLPAHLTVLKAAPKTLEPADRDFLAALGKRVREMREQRGMARKVLGQQARISERYIAQLEAGEGNISIVLLRRIVAALGLSVTDVLADRGGSIQHRQIRKFLEQVPQQRLEEVIFRLMSDFGAEEVAQQTRQ
jgi:XRE family transcriptional regulator, aerobic/anaerobic benzoate catabolism transcriptional regulator